MFNDRLDKVLTELKITNKELSKILKERFNYQISPESLGKYRNSTRTPQPKLIEYILNITNSDANMLFRDNFLTPAKQIPISGTSSCGKATTDNYQGDNEYAYYNGEFYTPKLYCVICLRR